MEDAQIVGFFLNRDEAAITHTSQKYGARLRSLAAGIVRDPDTA